MIYYLQRQYNIYNIINVNIRHSSFNQIYYLFYSFPEKHSKSKLLSY